MNKPIRALILAAGLGTRLRPLTLSKPKCLVEINKKPILELWIEKLEDINAQKIIVNTHYLSDQVNNFLNKKYKNTTKIEVFHETRLYGTAGTLIANHDLFLNSTGIMIHADNFSNMQLFHLIEAHKNKPSNCLLTMLTFTTDNPESCGIVEVDKKGVVINFHEKIKNPPGNLANGAVYVFDNNFLDWLITKHPKAKDFSTEVLPLLNGKIFTFHTNLPYIDIGTPEKLQEARDLNSEIND